MLWIAHAIGTRVPCTQFIVCYRFIIASAFRSIININMGCIRKNMMQKQYSPLKRYEAITYGFAFKPFTVIRSISVHRNNWNDSDTLTHLRLFSFLRPISYESQIDDWRRSFTWTNKKIPENYANSVILNVLFFTKMMIVKPTISVRVQMKINILLAVINLTLIRVFKTHIIIIGQKNEFYSIHWPSLFVHWSSSMCRYLYLLLALAYYYWGTTEQLHAPLNACDSGFDDASSTEEVIKYKRIPYRFVYSKKRHFFFILSRALDSLAM